MRLHPAYAVAAAVIAAVAIVSLTLNHWAGADKQEREEARARAIIAAELVRESFLSYSHAGGSPGNRSGFAGLINSINDCRAGSILAVGLNNTSGRQDLLKSAIEAGVMNSPQLRRLPSGIETLSVSLPLVNSDQCRQCHKSGPDIIGILEVSIAPEGGTDRALMRRRAILMSGIWILLGVVLALGLAAYVFIDRDGDRRGSADVKEKGPVAAFEKGLVAPGPVAPSMESLQRLEKMATVSELASVIAHEIKNPLAGISGAVQVLAEGFPEHDQRKEIMREVLGEVERLDKAVRNLLSFARPPEPSFISVPLGEVVERSVRLVRGKAKKQGIDVNIIPAAGDALVHADPDQMQQAFLNVLINSLHAMPGGGLLTVRVILRRQSVDVSISDTGVGIPSESIGRIFEPFYTTKTAGTGLGLAITRNIVERHGGRISVESASGAGTTVFITLPLWRDETMKGDGDA